MGLGQRATEDREVLREGVHQAAANGAVAGDHAIAGNALFLHPEVGGSMDDELVELLERAGIEEEGDALPRRELAFVVLAVDAVLSASQLAFPFAALELVEPGFGGHRLQSLSRGLQVQQAER